MEKEHERGDRKSYLLLKLIYCWVNQIPKEVVERKLRVGRCKTLVNWYNFVREVYVKISRYSEAIEESTVVRIKSHFFYKTARVSYDREVENNFNSPLGGGLWHPQKWKWWEAWTIFVMLFQNIKLHPYHIRGHKER